MSLNQYKTQVLSPNLATKAEPDYFFLDGRAMRQTIPGTIARGHLATDTEYHQGIQSGSTSVTASVAETEVLTGLSSQDQDDAGNSPPAAQPPAPRLPQCQTTELRS